jgi:signal transduction histidine kinase
LVLLETNISEDVKVKADENMLNTILRNLIQNGIKFSNEGGKVLINAEKENNYIKWDLSPVFPYEKMVETLKLNIV